MTHCCNSWHPTITTHPNFIQGKLFFTLCRKSANRAVLGSDSALDWESALSAEQLLDGTKDIKSEFDPIHIESCPSLTRSVKQPETQHISAETDAVDNNNIGIATLHSFANIMFLILTEIDHSTFIPTAKLNLAALKQVYTSLNTAFWL